MRIWCDWILEEFLEKDKKRPADAGLKIIRTSGLNSSEARRIENAILALM